MTCRVLYDFGRNPANSVLTRKHHPRPPDHADLLCPRLVDMIDLRQSYARLAPRLALQVGRYAHANEVKRLSKVLKRLKG